MQNISQAPKTTIKFTWHGKPVPKPRMTRRDVWAERPVVMRYRAFKDDFILAAKRAGFESGSIIHEVHIQAYIPLSTRKRREKRNLAGLPHQELPGPDGDNVLKAVCDSLTPQDVTIWRKSISKYWDDGAGERLEVELTCTPFSWEGK